MTWPNVSASFTSLQAHGAAMLMSVHCMPLAVRVTVLLATSVAHPHAHRSGAATAGRDRSYRTHAYHSDQCAIAPLTLTSAANPTRDCRGDNAPASVDHALRRHRRLARVPQREQLLDRQYTRRGFKIMQVLVGTHAVRVLECDRKAGHAAAAALWLPGAIVQSSQLVQKITGPVTNAQ